MYLEADAAMKTYEDSEGKLRSSLNLVQTKMDVLKRPVPSADGEAADAEGMSAAQGEQTATAQI